LVWFVSRQVHGLWRWGRRVAAFSAQPLPPPGETSLISKATRVWELIKHVSIFCLEFYDLGINNQNLHPVPLPPPGETFAATAFPLQINIPKR
jgi:hypothetical protein